MRKIWQQTRSAVDRINYNRAIRVLKNSLHKELNKNIGNYLFNLSPKESANYSLWKATKSLKRPQQFKTPIHRSNDKWAKTDDEKVVLFADHLYNVFQPPPREISEQEEKNLLQDIENQNTDSSSNPKVKLKEIKSIIKNLKNKKAPGYDGINEKLLKERPIKALRYITILMNASFRMKIVPDQFKVAQIILVPKPGKKPELVTSYRPISLLPIMSKICEKLMSIRLTKLIKAKNLIPNRQFGFRNHHATIEQVNRITAIIRKSLENKRYCSAVFLDVAQAFDKVWHEGLLWKLKKNLPLDYYFWLKSYLENRTFQVKINNTMSKLMYICAGVPQGSILGPLLYLLYTADLPYSENINKSVTIATYADDTTIVACDSDPKNATNKLQKYLSKAESWFKNWRIKVQDEKSTHVTFTLRKENCPPVYMYNKPIPQSEHVKYLGMHLDRRFTWRQHIWMKRKQLDMTLRKMYWILGKKSKLSMENKILLYKSILKPVWTYGIQLWGTASKSNIDILERFQSKYLRMITHAPWFIPNDIIRNDLNIPTVKSEITNFYKRYRVRLFSHPNVLANKLLNENIYLSRLKKYKNITI